MKIYRYLILLAALAICAVIGRADTVSQTLTIDQIDVLAGGTAPIDVQRFDPALGTLTDVQITYESFVFHSAFRIWNDSNEIISDYSTGVTIIPWLDDGRGSWFPTLSVTMSMIPVPACGPILPFFFPHSAHLFDATRDTSAPYWCNGHWMTYTPITISLLSHISPPLSYWTGPDSIHFDVTPSYIYDAHLNNPWAPWPGRVIPLGIWWEGEITITYEYTPGV